jgi:hypothetical protein
MSKASIELKKLDERYNGLENAPEELREAVYSMWLSELFGDTAQRQEADVKTRLGRVREALVPYHEELS